MVIKYIPFIIGCTIGISLNLTIGWWGFLILFPWIGLAITIGIDLQQTLKGRRKLLGRKVRYSFDFTGPVIVCATGQQ